MSHSMKFPPKSQGQNRPKIFLLSWNCLSTDGVNVPFWFFSSSLPLTRSGVEHILWFDPLRHSRYNRYTEEPPFLLLASSSPSESSDRPVLSSSRSLSGELPVHCITSAALRVDLSLSGPMNDRPWDWVFAKRMEWGKLYDTKRVQFKMFIRTYCCFFSGLWNLRFAFLMLPVSFLWLWFMLASCWYLLSYVVHCMVIWLS